MTATPPQSDPEPRPPLAPTVAATLSGALALALGGPAAVAAPLLGAGLAAALVALASAILVPRLRMSRRTAGELLAAAAQAALLALAVLLAGPGPGVAVFAALVVAVQAALASLRGTVAATALLAAAAVALAALGAGADASQTAALALGLLGLGLGTGALVGALRRQRTALARQLQRVLGDLELRKSVEQRLRETHESLERQAVALTDTNRRIEREIEVRRRAEARALEAAHLKDSFLRTVSHELRTPLNAVIGYTEGLLEDDPARPLKSAHADLERVLESSRTLLELIDNILDLSTIETGKASVDLAPVDLPALVDELVAAVAPRAARNGNTIRVKREPDLPAIHSDRARLRQILLHLLDNACKFTHGGTIRLLVRAEQAEDRTWFILEVSDTGIGIDADTLGRLFVPFVQADGSTTRRYGGAGIGLAMCRHSCSLLGGDISATSAPGAGSTFTVRLPAAPLDPRAAGVVVASHF